MESPAVGGPLTTFRFGVGSGRDPPCDATGCRCTEMGAPRAGGLHDDRQQGSSAQENVARERAKQGGIDHLHEVCCMHDCWGPAVRAEQPPSAHREGACLEHDRDCNL